ncbi:vacuolar sorting protein 9 domain-containing protein, partial [Reticulomyxa filosa]
KKKKKVREFMNALKEYIIKKKGDEFRRRLWKQMQQGSPVSPELNNKTSTSTVDKSQDGTSPTDNEQSQSEIVEPYFCVYHICHPFNSFFFFLFFICFYNIGPFFLLCAKEICEEMTKDETRVLKAKIVKLIKENQSFFGIKTSFQNNDNWRSAVYELSLFKHCLLPSEKITALVNTARAIYQAHEDALKEKEAATGVARKDDSFITGDDLLPVPFFFLFLCYILFYIVIYVIVNSSKNEPILTDRDLMLLEALVDPELQRSEPGYYLTVFHAATQWWLLVDLQCVKISFLREKIPLANVFSLKC